MPWRLHACGRWERGKHLAPARELHGKGLMVCVGAMPCRETLAGVTWFSKVFSELLISRGDLGGNFSLGNGPKADAQLGQGRAGSLTLAGLCWSMALGLLKTLHHPWSGVFLFIALLTHQPYFYFSALSPTTTFQASLGNGLLEQRNCMNVALLKIVAG